MIKTLSLLGILVVLSFVGINLFTSSTSVQEMDSRDIKYVEMLDVYYDLADHENLAEVELMEVYQGPVPEGYDEEHFRKTGETRRLDGAE